MVAQPIYENFFNYLVSGNQRDPGTLSPLSETINNLGKIPLNG